MRWFKDHAALLAVIVSAASASGTLVNSYNTSKNVALTASNSRDQRQLQFLQLKYLDQETMPHVELAVSVENDVAHYVARNTGKGTAFQLELFPNRVDLRDIIPTGELKADSYVEGRLQSSEIHPGVLYVLVYLSGHGTFCKTDMVMMESGSLIPTHPQSCATEYDFLLADQKGRVSTSGNGIYFGNGPPTQVK